jgi:hypothetical protein
VIVIARNQLKFLLAGRSLTVPDRDPERYVRGRTYAVTIIGNRTGICRVQIVEATEVTIKIRLAESDTPRMLARHSQYGYTDMPSRAMFDEPEAVDPKELEGINRRRAEVIQLKADILERTDELAEGADREERRRLRNVARSAAAL